MKINLKKLGKIQEEFRLGNIGNFTALEIKNLLNEEGDLTLWLYKIYLIILIEV